MKKIMVTIMAMVCIMTMFTGCGKEETTREKVVTFAELFAYDESMYNEAVMYEWQLTHDLGSNYEFVELSFDEWNGNPEGRVAFDYLNGTAHCTHYIYK